MAISINARSHALRASAVALAALALTPVAAPARAQTVYREYDDGRVETWAEEDAPAPLRRPPPRPFDDEDDERFERDDDPDDDDFADEPVEDHQGSFDLAPKADRTAPRPPPSVDAKPPEKAWKPAL
jgi:hypothetical protein